MDKEWSREEIDACFYAYLEMYVAQRKGKEFVKAEVIKTLRAGPMGQRTKTSVQRRFQNFSHIFETQGLGWVRGYVPLKNVGIVVRKRVTDLIDRAELR